MVGEMAALVRDPDALFWEVGREEMLWRRRRQAWGFGDWTWLALAYVRYSVVWEEVKEYFPEFAHPGANNLPVPFVQ